MSFEQIERCNYFLNKMVECAKRGEEVEGRLVSFLLHDPINDGGQWDMLINLINRWVGASVLLWHMESVEALFNDAMCR